MAKSVEKARNKTRRRKTSGNALANLHKKKVGQGRVVGFSKPSEKKKFFCCSFNCILGRIIALLTTISIAWAIRLQLLCKSCTEIFKKSELKSKELLSCHRKWNFVHAKCGRLKWEKLEASWFLWFIDDISALHIPGFSWGSGTFISVNPYLIIQIILFENLKAPCYLVRATLYYQANEILICRTNGGAALYEVVNVKAYYYIL